MKNSNTIIIIILLLVIGFGAYAFIKNKNAEAPLPATNEGQSQNTSNPSNETSNTTINTTINVGSTVKEFTVSGKNFSFVPGTMTVKKGDTVKITFINENGNHDLRIDEFNAKTAIIPSGSKETITFVADKAGSFEYYCSVGQHRAMGMKGTLIVE